MLFLRVYCPPETTDLVLQILDRDDVRHVVHSGTTADGSDFLTADLQPGAGDAVLDGLVGLGIPPSDISLTRQNVARPVGDELSEGSWSDTGDDLVWAEVADQARENVALHGTYLIFMAVAGVIAAFGVIQASSVLIVGAMAVSPDLLPLAGACVGVVAGHARLAVRGAFTLCAGLGCAALTAFLVTLALRAFDLLGADFSLHPSGLSSLSQVTVATAVIAFVAGVAAMLSFETRASAAVGVAISVTTIPAAAFLGVAAGVGEPAPALHALAVLGMNIFMLLAAGTLTLVIQRALYKRPRHAGDVTSAPTLRRRP